MSDIDEVEAMLSMVKLVEAEPTLLEVARYATDRNRRLHGRMMDARVRDEIHRCLRHAGVATAAMLIQHRNDPTWRWLDLCPRCVAAFAEIVQDGQV